MPHLFCEAKQQLQLNEYALWFVESFVKYSEAWKPALELPINYDKRQEVTQSFSTPETPDKTILSGLLINSEENRDLVERMWRQITSPNMKSVCCLVCQDLAKSVSEASSQRLDLLKKLLKPCTKPPLKTVSKPDANQLPKVLPKV